MRIRSAHRSALGAALAAVFILTSAAGPASAQLPDVEIANPKPSIADMATIAQTSLNGQTAYNVGLQNTRRQKSNSSNVANLQQGSSGTFATIEPGQEREVGVVCDPLPGYHCTTASLRAQLANDLNPNNNQAVSP